MLCCGQAAEGSLKEVNEGVEKVVDTAEKAVKDAEDAAKKASDAVAEAKKEIAKGSQAGATQAEKDAGDAAQQNLKQLEDDATKATDAIDTQKSALKAVQDQAEAIKSLKYNKLLKTGLIDGIDTGVVTGINPIYDAASRGLGAASSNSSVAGQPNGQFTYFNFLKYNDPIQASNCGTQVTHVGFE